MDQQQLISWTALAIAVVALLLSIGIHRRFSSARRSLALLQGTFQGKTLVDAVASYSGDLKALAGDLAELTRRQSELFEILGRSSRNLGLVRYDAFEDMGGKMSFSAALLDDHGDGVVLTSINGRNDARTYAKLIEAGSSSHNLSREEESAIEEALGGRVHSGRRARRSVS